MINESDLAKAFDKLHLASQDRTWIEARLGKQLTTTPTYDLRVKGTTNQFYVSLGRNGDQGVTSAVDMCGVAETPWIRVRVRRENERLVIREASAYAAGSGSGGGATHLNDLLDVQVPTPADGHTLQFSSFLGQWIDVVPPGGAGGAPSPHDLDSSHHEGFLPWSKIDASGGSIADLGDHNHGSLAGIAPDQHHAKLHDIIDAAHHKVTGAQYNVIGLTATDHLGILASSSNPGTTQKIVHTDANGGFIIGSGMLVVSPNTNKVTMDGTMFVFDNSTNIITFGAKTTFNDDATFNEPVDFNDSVTFDADIIRFNKDPQLYANIDFRAGDRNITAENSLHIRPSTDLYLESQPAGYPTTVTSRGMVFFPNDQVVRSPIFEPLITGIEGWAIDLGPGTYHQLAINSILVDNLYARKFIADEARVQRGEWFLTRSFGVVQETFSLPATNFTRDVWFEEAPGLGNFKLFVPGNWLQSRTIDWGTGLLIQAVWFKVVGVGVNGYVQRLPATDELPSRQQWRIQRVHGGYDGAIIAKGETLADNGIPRNVAVPNDFGQGQIWANALNEPDRGPFIQVQTFESVSVDNVPHFLPRVRMGNLQNTVDFTIPAWGFAAANNLGQAPSAGMSGIAIDTLKGTRLFNVDLLIYDSSIPTVLLDRTHGLVFHYDNDYDDWNDLRSISWVENVSTPGNPGDSGVSSISAFSGEDPTHFQTRGLRIDVEKAASSSEKTAIYMSAGSKLDDYSENSYLNLYGYIDLDDGTKKGKISSKAVEFHHQGNLRVYDADLSSSPVLPYLVDRSQLNVVDYRGRKGRDGGVTIEQQGGEFDDVFGGGLNGEAALHWRYRNRETQWFNPAVAPDIWYSMGISSGGSWRLTASDDLDAAPIISYNPDTGEVIINGWSPTGSTPPSGLIAGTGINLTGSVISVNATVARNTNTVNAGNGLSGGGSLTSNPTFTVRLQSPSGLIGGPTGIAISNTLAGTGLTMSASKVLSIDPGIFINPATQIITASDSGLKGGGPLTADVTLSLDLATTEPGLIITDGLTVDGSVIRNTTAIVADAPLSGGGQLGSGVHIGLILPLNSGLSTAGGLNIPTSIQGFGLLISPSKVLSVDTTVFVQRDFVINTTAPITGAGDFTTPKTIGLALSTPSGLAVVTGKLEVDNNIAGTGLIMTPATKKLSVDFSGVVPITRKVLGGLGLTQTSTGELSADVTLDVKNADTTLTVTANDVKVNQSFAYSWGGLHTFGAGFTGTVGVFRFNTDPQLYANLDFMGADRNITGSNNIVVSPTINLTLDPLQYYVYPGGNNKINLGGFNRKWSTLYASELYVETLVASSVLATIGGRIIVSPSSTLIADITASATTIDLKHQFAANTFLYLETFNFTTMLPQQEAIKLAATGTAITGGFRFTGISRGLNSLGVGKAWTSGDSLVSFGSAVKDGYIDLSSVKTAVDLPLGGQKIGPTISIYSRTSTASWKDVAPVVTMGQLSGFVGYGNEFGFATGNDLTLLPSTGFSGLTADKTNGLRMFNTDIRMYQGVNLVANFKDTGSLNFEIGGTAYGQIAWADDLGDGSANPVGNRGFIEVQTAGPTQPQSTMLISSYGVPSTSWTEGAIRLLAQRTSGAFGTVWVTASGTFFGNSSAIEAQEWGFIKPTTAYLASRLGIGIDIPTEKLHIYQDVNAAIRARLENPNAGVAAQVGIDLRNDLGRPLQLFVTSSNFTPSGIITPNLAYIQSNSINLLLRTVGAFDMVLGTNSVERMRILSGGNVGIGVDNPGSLLDLGAGDLGFLSNSGGNNTIQGNQSSSWLFKSRFDHITFQAGINDSNRRRFRFRAGDTFYGIYIDSNGKVMVGSDNTPTHPLHVYSNDGLIAGTGLLLEQAGSGDSRLQMTRASQNWVLGVDFSNSDAFSISPGTDLSGVLGITVLVGGNVGVGISVPLARLHVSQSSVGTGIGTGGLIEQLGTGDARLMFRRPSQDWTIGVDASNSNAFSISPGTDLSAATGLTQLISGNLGINNSTPGTYLHIGTTTPTFQPSAGIWLAPPLASVIMHLRSNTGLEMGVLAHSSAVGYMGTWSNHPLIIRSNNVDRITIAAGGGITISPATSITGLLSANSGITFGVTTLSDYAEGTFTPGIKIGATVISVSPATGKYTRVGNRVDITFYVNFAKGAATGALILTGLPVPVSGANTSSSVMFSLAGITCYGVHTEGRNGTSELGFYSNTGAAGGPVSMTNVHLGTSNTIWGSMTYFV